MGVNMFNGNSLIVSGLTTSVDGSIAVELPGRELTVGAEFNIENGAITIVVHDPSFASLLTDYAVRGELVSLALNYSILPYDKKET